MFSISASHSGSSNTREERSITINLRADPRSWDSGAKGWPSETSEHNADHCETNEGGGGSRVALKVASQTAVMADPGERAFNNPTLGENDEAVQLAAFDNFQLPGAGLGDSSRCLWSLIASIGEDALDEGEQTAGAPIEHPSHTIAILHVGGMDDNIQEQAECIDKDVPLAARNLLTRIKALRVEPEPPFWAALALWLSMIAVVGLASRPSCSRVAT